LIRLYPNGDGCHRYSATPFLSGATLAATTYSSPTPPPGSRTRRASRHLLASTRRLGRSLAKKPALPQDQGQNFWPRNRRCPRSVSGGDRSVDIVAVSVFLLLGFPPGRPERHRHWCRGTRDRWCRMRRRRAPGRSRTSWGSC
jgi:hypothetical protein